MEAKAFLRKRLVFLTKIQTKYGSNVDIELEECTVQLKELERLEANCRELEAWKSQTRASFEGYGSSMTQTSDVCSDLNCSCGPSKPHSEVVLERLLELKTTIKEIEAKLLVSSQVQPQSVACPVSIKTHSYLRLDGSVRLVTPDEFLPTPQTPGDLCSKPFSRVTVSGPDPIVLGSAIPPPSEFCDSCVLDIDSEPAREEIHITPSEPLLRRLELPPARSRPAPVQIDANAADLMCYTSMLASSGAHLILELKRVPTVHMPVKWVGIPLLDRLHFADAPYIGGLAVRCPFHSKWKVLNLETAELVRITCGIECGRLANKTLCDRGPDRMVAIRWSPAHIALLNAVHADEPPDLSPVLSARLVKALLE